MKGVLYLKAGIFGFSKFSFWDLTEILILASLVLWKYEELVYKEPVDGVFEDVIRAALKHDSDSDGMSSSHSGSVFEEGN